MHATLGVIFGTVVGGAQAWVLIKRKASAVKAWVPANIAGWVAGFLLEAWVLGRVSRPVLEAFGTGIGTTVVSQAIMGATSGLPVVAILAVIIVRSRPQFEWKAWALRSWTAFVVAGVVYAIFVRIPPIAGVGASGIGNAVLLALGWSMKGAIIGLATGKSFMER